MVTLWLPNSLRVDFEGSLLFVSLMMFLPSPFGCFEWEFSMDDRPIYTNPHSWGFLLCKRKEWLLHTMAPTNLGLGDNWGFE